MKVMLFTLYTIFLISQYLWVSIHSIPTPPIFSCVDNSTLTVRSDSYHYNVTKHSFLYPYLEWWWFEFVDQDNDLAFNFAYSVGDPFNLFGLQQSSVSSMVWNGISHPETAIFTKQDNFYNADQFQGSSENANLRIADKNFINLLNDTSYQVVGGTKDNSGGYVSWSLVYTLVPLIDAMQEIMKFDIPFVDVDVSWISYMPQAFVSGTLQVNGSTYNINTVGYHDHNYGEWPTKMLDWIWMQINQPSLAIASGALPLDFLNHGFTGYTYIRYKGENQKISDQCGDYFVLTPLNFTTTSDGKKYATLIHLDASNNRFMVNITWSVKIETYNPSSAPLKISVMEQISYYTGTLSIANSVVYKDENGNKKEDIQWVFAEKIEGYGFSEWSDKLGSDFE